MEHTLHDALMNLPGTEHEYKPAWEMDLYRVGGKIYAEIGTDKAGRPLLTVKLEPALSDLLRAQYPGRIVPGYYCNKVHWSSLYLDAEVPQGVGQTMLLNAYETVLSSLSKKARSAIQEPAAKQN